jgi:restriction system protein
LAAGKIPYRARKDVLITTSSFTEEAREYIAKIEWKIVLIDEPTLAAYMIDYDIGVTIARTFVVNRIDSDFFVEEA